MWIGTVGGLYLLNRNTGEYQFIEMEIGAAYINTLYQADDGLLYIGTNGVGVFVYNHQNKTFEHYFLIIPHWFQTGYLQYCRK